MKFELMKSLWDKSPLIHCITNYVTVNDCANILLACGASPIMADDEDEVEEITSICTGLVINIGTLNKRTIPAMLKAGKKAKELGHPVLLDPVGAGASALRTQTAVRIMEEVRPDVIRGNISEIKTLALGSATTSGVDAAEGDKIGEDNLGDAVRWAKELAAKTGAVIVITGAIDIAADSKRAFIVRNGHHMMGRITGSGCMLSAFMAAAVSSMPENKVEAAAQCLCAMGLAGQRAYEKTAMTGGGNSSFRNHLIDEICRMTDPRLLDGAKYEVR